MKKQQLLAVLLALAMCFALTACGGGAQTSPSPSPAQETSPAQSPAVEESPSEVPAEDGEPATVNLAVLSGPTGIGAAKLMADSDANQAQDDKGAWTSDNLYNYTIAADNTELVAGLSSGTFDIATMASNAAVNLYNKTDGGVRIIALGTLGVLHILEGGGNAAINSIADLRGRTVYAVGQGANPEYVLRYLLTENGLDPDKDVELVFGEASEITQKLMTGEAACAMLPVPAATAAIAKGEGKIRAALDLTQVWNDLDNGSEFIMTAVVARAEFVEHHKDKVDTFLKDYAASIDYVVNNVDEAAGLIAGYGITPSAGIAKAAIPQCHLTFIAGADMAPAISGYYEILYRADPAAVGGALPDDAIYYVP